MRVDRAAVPEPAALLKPYTSGAFKGKPEAERVAKEYADHVATGRPPVGFRFDYERHEDSDVEKALETLFHGKGAPPAQRGMRGSDRAGHGLGGDSVCRKYLATSTTAAAIAAAEIAALEAMSGLARATRNKEYIARAPSRYGSPCRRAKGNARSVGASGWAAASDTGRRSSPGVRHAGTDTST